MLWQYLSTGLLLLCWVQVESARILFVIPTPSISHQVVARPLVQELVKRGHEVTIITTDPVYERGKAPANLTEIDVHDISYRNFNDILQNHRGRVSDVFSQTTKLIRRFGTILDLQIQTHEVQELLKKPKDYFDVLVAEACSRVALGFSLKFQAPVILFSSFGAVSTYYSYLGAPNHPLLFPTILAQRLYSLSRWEKITEFAKNLVLDYIMTYTKEEDLKIIRKHFGEFSDDSKLFGNVKLLLVNEHPMWADNRPLPPNIHYIGGIHQAPDEDISNELKSYLDNSVNGVIYMSLGTNVLTTYLPKEKIEILTKVFAKLPYNILLKWDDKNITNLPPNVKVQKWFPQSMLLKHSKIKLFITQGGLQSTDEAINAGVPLLAIPMLGDQWYNAEKYVHHKIGLKLDIETLDEDVFQKAITTIITDESYKANMVRLRSLMREYPIQPVDLAVWWTEHVIKYGGDHLTPPSAYLHWTEYYEVELVLICLGVTSVTMYIMFHISKFFYRLILKRFLNFNIRIKTKYQ